MKIKDLRRTLTLLALGGFSMACGGGGLRYVVSDEMYGAVSGQNQEAITKAQRNLDEATAEIAKAEAQEKEATYMLRQAELDLSVAEARLEHASSLKDVADEFADEVRIASQQTLAEAMEQYMEAKELEIAHRETALEYAMSSVVLAKAKAQLAGAQLEEARAQAVSEATGPAALAVSDFKIQMSEEHQAVSGAEIEAANILKDVNETKAEFEKAMGAVPKTALSPDFQALEDTRRDKESLMTQVSRLEKQVSELQSANANMRTDDKKDTTPSDANPTEPSGETAPSSGEE